MQSFYRQLLLSFIALSVSLNCYTQCLTHQQYWNKILSVETDSKSNNERLQQALQLKNQYEKCGLQKDSVYARILHRIGALQYLNGDYEQAIQNTTAALHINTSHTSGAATSYILNNYYNLGLIYNALARYDEVIGNFSALVQTASHLQQKNQFLSRVHLMLGNIFYKKGDYEKDVEETTLGIPAAEEMNDSATKAGLLIERCEAYEMQQKLTLALIDVNEAMLLLKNSVDYDMWANAYRSKADILADQKQCKQAIQLYDKAILYRKKTNNADQVATDYNDAGYLLFYKCNNVTDARKYFTTAYKIARKTGNNYAFAMANNNIAQMYFYNKDYSNALKYYQVAMESLIEDFSFEQTEKNPTYSQLKIVEQKNFLEILFDNKSKCQLYLYKQTGDKNFLEASLATARLTDSLITDLRHEQSAEQTKLYWRNDTRDFFTRTLEACYLDNNPALAFFFMEKSQAVLLNDKLNELGASAHLPVNEARREEGMQLNVAIAQQNISELSDTSKNFADKQYKLLLAKNDLDQYIKSLEKKYPVYYQYKYADNVPSLQTLQQFLKQNNESFVHYFMSDTATYILAITPSAASLTKLSQQDLNKNELVNFLSLCADKEKLNNDYRNFARQSHLLYKTLFQKLQLPKGRVVICSDNFLIPFEVLCSDENGKNFLLYNYAFSYVYSARLLMKQFHNPSPQANFLGFAPVSFNPALNVSSLKPSAEALKASFSFYNTGKLFTHQNATRNNFFLNAPSYAVISIFSHARADTSENEPELFMQDSVIHLSELQLLNNPSAQLVLLSACETNIGKNATGEGVYSLARGFASAGIPSVAATLWKADENTIYAISEKFNQYLGEGFRKDEALQKAKLFYIQNNTADKLLPYYWANMILIGNADALKLNINQSNTRNTVMIGLCIFIAAAIPGYMFWRRKKRRV